jgi:hypothetical protein
MRYYDAAKCTHHEPEKKEYDFGFGVVETEQIQICENDGEPVADVSLLREGECFHDSYTRKELLHYLGDATLKERFGRSDGLPLGENPEARACGAGTFAQARLPGTVIGHSWAHPEIRFPPTHDETGVYTTPEATSIASAWGATNFTLTRGNGDVRVNEMTRLGTGDLKCYKVPVEGSCGDIDWSLGGPPIGAWHKVEHCVSQVECPGAKTRLDGTTLYDEDERSFELWEEGSTHVVKNVSLNDAARAVNITYGFCNAMPETEILAVTPFDRKSTTQHDNVYSF